MRTILPGKPQAQLQAIDRVSWSAKQITAYLSGSSIVILGAPHDLIQTIHHDEDGEFVALAIDPITGKLATSTSKEVVVYSPYGLEEDALKWSLESTIPFEKEHKEPVALSWSTDAELLVADHALRLYQTDTGNRLIWSRTMASLVRFASFSPDASMLATAGACDRLIKLWRRQAFGVEDTRFDFNYLPHPKTVTAFRWRKSHSNDHHLDNVLFSICSDKKIRIWATSDAYGAHCLRFWAEIDMTESLQSRSPRAPASSQRYAFFLEYTGIASATSQSMKQESTAKFAADHAGEHLIENSRTRSEVCIILDEHGHMSAWVIRNIGRGRKKSTDIFNITHVSDFNLQFLKDQASYSYVSLLPSINSSQSDLHLVLLAHHFDGRIMWFESELHQLFDSSPRGDRLTAKALWTGHDASIEKIDCSLDGTALVSRTNMQSVLVWKHAQLEESTTLSRSSHLKTSEAIYGAAILGGGSLVATLHETRLSIWHAETFTATEVATCCFRAKGIPHCLFQVRSGDQYSQRYFLAMLTEAIEVLIWSIDRPKSTALHPEAKSNSDFQIQEICKMRLNVGADCALVASVLPPVSGQVHPGLSNGCSEDTLIACTPFGTVTTWSARVAETGTFVTWSQTAAIETGFLAPTIVSGSSMGKAVLVDSSRTRLAIWDIEGGQQEYDVLYEDHEVVQELKWSDMSHEISVLAIQFPHKIILLIPLRYDFLGSALPWTPLQTILTRELTSHPIGDTAWLSRQNLAIAAGNQLFIYDDEVDTSGTTTIDIPLRELDHKSPRILDLVSHLNRPLPIYHPQIFCHCILTEKIRQSKQIIAALDKAVRFCSDINDLDYFLSLPLHDFYTADKNVTTSAEQVSSQSVKSYEQEETTNLDQDVLASLHENLAVLALPNITQNDQIYLAGMIDYIASIERHTQSMDDLALRYMFMYTQRMRRKGQNYEPRRGLHWQEIIWAFHSGSQEILVDLVSRQYGGKMQWEHARESGIFMWMADIDALKSQFEVVARNEYTKTDEKNPIHCSLFYLALKKKNILLGLWRMASWNREQASTQKFLKNDFTETRWKTAALKNAYALLSKRRFEYAAAFFLLAGHLQDAVNICAHQLEDLQLAVAVARVYDGDDSKVLRSLIEEKILPQAAVEGNRWLGTWAFWMLGRRIMAVRCLVCPTDTLKTSPKSRTSHAQSHLFADPTVVNLYDKLRYKAIQSPSDALQVSIEEEWRFVIQNARIYRRMGCHIFALDLVRNWKFVSRRKARHLSQDQFAAKTANQSTFNHINSTPVVATPATTQDNAEDENDEEEDDEGGSEEEKPDVQEDDKQDDQKNSKKASKQPTMFTEPDAGSLLDNFGF